MSRGRDTRPTSEIDEELVEAVIWRRGDVYDAQEGEGAVRGLCFPSGRLLSGSGGHHEEHRKVHVKCTKLLAEAAHSQFSFERFVHTSTVGTTGTSGILRPTSVVEMLTQTGDVLGKNVQSVPLPSVSLFWLADLVEGLSDRIVGTDPVPPMGGIFHQGPGLRYEQTPGRTRL